jgi:hypothetical protein
VRLRTTCISCVYESLNRGFMRVMRDLCALKMLEYVSALKTKFTHNLCQGKFSDTTCNMPDIKSTQNKNKMLEMAE